MAFLVQDLIEELLKYPRDWPANFNDEERDFFPPVITVEPDEEGKRVILH